MYTRWKLGSGPDPDPEASIQLSSTSLYIYIQSLRAFPGLSWNFFVWKSFYQGNVCMCKFLCMNITRSVIGGREFPYKHCESNFCSLIPQEKNNRVNTSYLKNNLLFFSSYFNLIFFWFKLNYFNLRVLILHIYFLFFYIVSMSNFSEIFALEKI